ncbi:hypothetical protein Bca4012_036575 [Brassica carinata]
MANSRVFFSDLKSGRCSSIVEARLLRFWERREMKRPVIASLMVVKNALGSFLNLTNLALLSMMKNGEFMPMITIIKSLWCSFGTILEIHSFQKTIILGNFHGI